MKRGRFPQRIKRGSCIVTIYRTPRNGYRCFTVAHYDVGGKFCRRTFADYAEARSAAQDTAENFAAGESDTHVLSGQELLVSSTKIRLMEGRLCADSSPLGAKRS